MKISFVFNDLDEFNTFKLGIIEEYKETLKDKKETKTEPKKEEKIEDKEVNNVTEEAVRKKFIELNSAKNRDKLKDILNKYEADNISALKPENYNDVMEDLEALSA